MVLNFGFKLLKFRFWMTLTRKKKIYFDLGHCSTLWKFKTVSATEILREMNFIDHQTVKLAILTFQIL